jgi:hypothetical protein
LTQSPLDINGLSRVAFYVAVEEDHSRALEEEEKTQYSSPALGEEWKFEMVRSTFGAFRRAASSVQPMEEEA